jgi:HK97 family phage major capsid protein
LELFPKPFTHFFLEYEMNKVELRAERTRLIAEGEAMTSEQRAWTPEEEAKFADLEAKVNEIDAMLNADPAADVTASADSARSKLQSWKASAPVTPSVQRSKVYSSAPNFVRDFGDKNDKQKRSLAIKGWLAGGSRSELVNDEIRSAAHETGLNIDADRLTLNLCRSAPRNAEELRANLNITTAGEGGYLVPSDFVASLEKAMLGYGGIREKASIIRTSGGNTLTMPMLNDTTGKATIVGEGVAITAANAAFTQFSLGAFKYAAAIQASWELIQDSGINLESELGTILGERLARGQAEHLCTGVGTTTPTGLATSSFLGATQITNNVIVFQDVLNLFHSVDVNYRKNATWIVHDNFLALLRNMVDASGYLIFSGPNEGQPTTLLGSPIVVCNDMSSDITTAAKKIALFGDISAYKVREVSNIELTRQSELYSSSGLVGWVIHHRLDAKLADAGTHPVKHLVAI